ncbi:hypothetical protein GQ602_002313 [Ophiocordyceps camponoti-floridani]|uniref:Uncharacterized protein n=1 Tax=Ophiocordyceps camponoti-floridani TaxID=2030778 RepID=A0A8H4QA45_9HYPO|nr:hypothetical protein GQ602_002313 [Ophiocordyceps camponoti-floridani]
MDYFFWNSETDSFAWLVVVLAYELLWYLLATAGSIACLVSSKAILGSLFMGLATARIAIATIRLLLVSLPLVSRLVSLLFVAYQLLEWTRTELVLPAFVILLFAMEVDVVRPTPVGIADACCILAAEILTALAMCLHPNVGSTELPPMVERAAKALAGRVAVWMSKAMVVISEAIVMVDARTSTSGPASSEEDVDTNTSDDLKAQRDRLPGPEERQRLQRQLPESLQRLIRERDDSRVNLEDQVRLRNLELIIADNLSAYEAILNAAPRRPVPCQDFPAAARWLRPSSRPSRRVTAAGRIRKGLDPRPVFRTMAKDPESPRGQYGEARAAAVPERPSGQDGAVVAPVAAAVPERPSGQDGAVVASIAAEGPQSPLGEEGPEAVMVDVPAAEPKTSYEGEGEVVGVAAVVEPETPRGEDGEAEVAVDLAANMPESPMGSGGEAAVGTADAEPKTSYEGEGEAEVVADQTANMPEVSLGSEGEVATMVTNMPESSVGRGGEAVLDAAMPESSRGEEGSEPETSYEEDGEEAAAANMPEVRWGSEGEVALVVANMPESSVGREGEVAVGAGVADPETSQGEDGDVAMVIDLAVGEPESPRGEEGETVLESGAHAQPESPYGQEVQEAFGKVHDASEAEVAMVVDEPESSYEQDGEEMDLVVGEAEPAEADFSAVESERPRGQEDEGEDVYTGMEVETFLDGGAQPEALGGVEGEWPLDSPFATTTGMDVTVDMVDAGDSLEPELSTDGEGRGVNRHHRVAFASPEVASQSQAMTGLQSCAGGFDAENSMEWEATDGPAIAAGGSVIEADDVGMPMDLDTTYSYDKPPMDFRESSGEDVESVHDEWPEDCWMLEEEDSDQEGEVGQAIEDGTLAMLTAAFASLALGDEEESDAVMAGGPEGVLEVASGGRCETAPQSNDEAMEGLRPLIDWLSADQVMPEAEQPQVAASAADVDVPAIEEPGYYDEALFEALLLEGTLYDQVPAYPEPPVEPAQEPAVAPHTGDISQGVTVGTSTTAAGPDGQHAVPAVTADALTTTDAGEVPGSAEELGAMDDLERDIWAAFDEVDAQAAAAAFWDGQDSVPGFGLPGGMAASYWTPPEPTTPAASQALAVATATREEPQRVVTEGEEGPERPASPGAIAKRKKLLPRSRLGGGQAQQPSEPLVAPEAPPAASADNDLPMVWTGEGAPAAEEEVDNQPGPEDDSSIPIDPRLWDTFPGGGATDEPGQSSRPDDSVASETLRADPDSDRRRVGQGGPAYGDNALSAGVSSTPQVVGRADDGARANLGGGLLMPGGIERRGPVPALASLVQAPPALPTTSATLSTGQVTASSPAAGGQSRGDADKLQRRAKALQAKKPSLFHQKGRAAPSTAYGTRAPGSAEKDRQHRSLPGPEDDGAAAKQADDGRGSEASQQTPTRGLAIVPIAQVKERPPHQERQEEEEKGSEG